MKPSNTSKFAVIERWYAAYEARDVEAICRLAHPDILVLPVIPPVSNLLGATFHGHDGLRSFMRWSFRTYPHVKVGSTTCRDVPPSILASTTFLLNERSAPRTEATAYTLFDVDEEGIHRVAVFTSEREALAAVAGKPVLTPREREVIRLLAQGLTSPQIADQLFVSPATVRTHVQNARRRLGASTSAQAVSMALKLREITP
jgi:DNA-binding CsgD family transcriptional regulator